MLLNKIRWVACPNGQLLSINSDSASANRKASFFKNKHTQRTSKMWNRGTGAEKSREKHVESLLFVIGSSKI